MGTSTDRNVLGKGKYPETLEVLAKQYWRHGGNVYSQASGGDPSGLRTLPRRPALQYGIATRGSLGLEPWRCGYAGRQTNDPLLIGQWNQRLKHSHAQHAFTRLCKQCGISGSPPPRLHDLRHNYACGCLQLWREQQQEGLDALFPVLANAMGHVNFRSTQHYMHIDATALRSAGSKLHTHVYSTKG